ncbi:MAG: HAMP domain-containing sensor histidine kinase [Ignavibacteriaceae bacterium]|nr:HAMP domain-containing sensor histidine kinase [Ignavibacteriaceae bacterium]
MIQLVPFWINSYVEYWNTIHKRNLWLIKLRYGAVIMLAVFLVSARQILSLSFSREQDTALIIITLSILIYNLLLHYGRQFVKQESGKFNPLHFSLLQMILDLTALGLIVYYTGSIETPLFMLFVFHMIIGSLILPGAVIYTIACAVILLFNLLIFSEYFRFIPHHSVNGLLAVPLYTNINFIIAYDVIFSFVIIVSVLIANNIASQLYKIEQQLVELLDKLKAAEEEKQKYIIGIVHEIKTPLAAVHSYLDIVLDKILGPVNSRIEERLQRARVRSGEAIQMINDVLKISKLRLLDEMAKEAIELSDIIVPVIKKQSVNLRAKHIMLNYFDGRTIKKLIKGDKLLLEIAFSNLISNAVKYVGNNGMIEVDVLDNENFVEIEVCDNGIGIPQNDLGKIFNDFFRASNIKDKSYEGTGLGLSVVKQIVERHGGNISVESPSKLATENKPGASFKIKLFYDVH